MIFKIAGSTAEFPIKKREKIYMNFHIVISSHTLIVLELFKGFDWWKSCFTDTEYSLLCRKLFCNLYSGKLHSIHY